MIESDEMSGTEERRALLAPREPLAAGDIQRDRSALERDGLCIVANVLTSDQCDLLRAQAVAFLDRRGTPQNGGAITYDIANEADEIRWIFDDTPLLGVVRNLLGEDASFLHHAGVSHNSYTGWHKDVAGHNSQGQPLNHWDQASEVRCGVYKVALYLQDHTGDNTALSYVTQSHLDPDFSSLGKRIRNYLRHSTTHPAKGSLVIFDQRLSHTGVAPSLVTRGLYRALKNEKSKGQLWQWERKLRGMQDRVFLQMAFGDKTVISREHASVMADRQLRMNDRCSYRVSSSLEQTLNDNNFDIFPGNQALGCPNVMTAQDRDF